MYTINDIIHAAYRNWIELHVVADEASDNCSLWCRVMHSAFPELTIVASSVKHRFSNEAYHEYCIAEDGTIVDPTRAQFDHVDPSWTYNRHLEHVIVLGKSFKSDNAVCMLH